nr:MAG TPA: RNA polymerase II-like protein [Caudoviricetes sp.]
MRADVKPGWGIDPTVPDPDPRRCPSCGVAILPGRAQCHACYLRAAQLARAYTERVWMTRHHPDYRPRSLFPEDYDQEEVTR